MSIEARKPMFVEELGAILRYRAAPHPLRPDRVRIEEVLLFLAEHVYEARLIDGRKIHDVMDFKQWLEELAQKVNL